jgi:NodT family efflux transporter outer membrane factor (OMF) lipoprotein
MVGPTYHAPPPVCIPSEFEQAKGEAATPVQDDDLHEWWARFNDPILNELIAEALCANHDYRIALERITQARSQYRIERSYLWPEIDLHASGTRSRISENLFPRPDSFFIPNYLDMFQLGFDAIWELDIWGKYRHNTRAAYFTTQSLADDSQAIMISLVSEVAVNYVAIRSLQSKIFLANERVAADERELEITLGLNRTGLDNEMKIASMVSTIESDRATIPVLESSLKQTIFTVAFLLGRPPECFAQRFDEFYPIPSGKDRVPIGLPSDLLRRRPDVRSAERQLGAATEKIGAAVADLFPHVALTGISLGSGDKIGSSYGYESDKVDTLLTSPSRMFSYGLGLNWALIDFGRIRGNIDARTSEQRQAILNYEKTVIGSLKDVESALAAYFDEIKRSHSLMKKLEADNHNFEITAKLYQIGLAAEIQVLEAEKKLIESESQYIDSEQALTGDLIAIYKALGGSWVCNY